MLLVPAERFKFQCSRLYNDIVRSSLQIILRIFIGRCMEEMHILKDPT